MRWWVPTGPQGMAGAVEAGRVYVLYGPLDSGATIDLAAAEHPLSIIYGIDALDHAGSTVARWRLLTATGTTTLLLARRLLAPCAMRTIAPAAQGMARKTSARTPGKCTWCTAVPSGVRPLI